MNLSSRISRVAGLMLAVFVALVTFAVTAHAVQSITTANAAIVNYNVAPNTYGPTIAPVVGQPVSLMCTQTTLNYRGVGHVSLLRIAGSFVEWTGLESPSPSTITSGYSGTTGTHVLYCDYSHSVDLQVLAPDLLRLHNGPNVSPSAVGTVTMMW